MVLTWLAAGMLLTPGPARQAAGTTPAADVVLLRDGTTLIGQVAGTDRRGALVVVLRRAWAERNVPRRVEGWNRTEAAEVMAARLQRRARLVQWRKERAPDPSRDGPLLPWIDREIERTSDTRPPRTVLRRVEIAGGDLRSVTRRDPETARLLRLGWLEGLDDVEAMTVDTLRTLLTARDGLAPGNPAPLGALLPPATESDDEWRWRRGATEAVHEAGLRFVRFRQFILPENGPGPDLLAQADTTELLDSPAAQEAYRSILRVGPVDPVRARLDAAGARGRVGAIVSKVEFLPDRKGAESESSLWIRQSGGDWKAVLSRRSTVRDDEPAGTAPAAVNVPIRTAVAVLELFAAAAPLPEQSRRRQAEAVAVQRAVGQSRAALDLDLLLLVLPVTAPDQRSGAPR